MRRGPRADLSRGRRSMRKKLFTAGGGGHGDTAARAQGAGGSVVREGRKSSGSRMSGSTGYMRLSHGHQTLLKGHRTRPVTPELKDS